MSERGKQLGDTIVWPPLSGAAVKAPKPGLSD
jgi:hypothetical protein